MTAKQASVGKCFVGKIEHGKDLLDELTALCQKENIRSGHVSAIGAMQKARYGFYHQAGRKYEFVETDEDVELLALVGNVSLKEGAIFVHAHATFADKTGRAFGGHLAQGTTVFACEYCVIAFEGAELSRSADVTTGLSLWST